MFGYIPEFREYYLKLLELTQEYQPHVGGASAHFHYQDTDHTQLKELKDRYELEEIAGGGSETDQVLNLTNWVNKRLTHGSMSHHEINHSLHILELAEQESLSANCYVIATVLNEVLLSMGFKTKRVQCMPYDAHDLDSHVVNLVYLSEQKRWIYVDASWDKFVTDESGHILDLKSFRERLAKNKTVLVNGQDTETDESTFYITYMSKNLFWFLCPAVSEFNSDAVTSTQTYYALYPNYYNALSKLQSNRKVMVPLYNPEEFWKCAGDNK
ncbi:transglutaminase domain-containing protein [Alkalicoccobacillus gibsonii]|uniref:transglutaminase domain-containing protein n=1 Tax=Alkalicoccobacillus gibsonii TaxID=79881 RepID=UPI003F7BE018